MGGNQDATMTRKRLASSFETGEQHDFRVSSLKAWQPVRNTQIKLEKGSPELFVEGVLVSRIRRPPTCASINTKARK